jgi:hypothetical protein
MHHNLTYSAQRQNLYHIYPFVIHSTLDEIFIAVSLTLILLTTTIDAALSNASKWQMGFNSAFKGLTSGRVRISAVKRVVTKKSN